MILKKYVSHFHFISDYALAVKFNLSLFICIFNLIFFSSLIFQVSVFF